MCIGLQNSELLSLVYALQTWALIFWAISKPFFMK